MSKLFRDSESLGKEVVSDLNIIAQKWSKMAAAKFFLQILFYLCSLYLNVVLPPLPKVPCKKLFFNFSNLGENKWKEVVSDLNTFVHKGCKIAAAA